jgi:hypothetical protein
VYAGGGIVIKRTFIAGLAIAAIGCGNSEQRRAEEAAERAAEQLQQGAEQMQRAAEQMAQGSAEQMAQGLQQMTQGLQQMAAGSGDVLDYEVLKELLPDVNGWTRSGVRGEQTNAPIKVSRAEAQYARGDSNVELEVIDASLNPMFLAPMTMFLSAGFSERSDEGFKRSGKIGDNPAIEEWNVPSKRGEVTVVVANRFVVQATGHDVDDIAAVRQIIDAVDLSKLASLK